MMKLTFHYGTEVLTLPAALAEHVDKATKKDLRVLLALAADPLARIDPDAACRALESKLSLSAREVDAALAFWRGTGILVTAETEGEAAPILTEKTPTAPMPRVVADKGLPVYSSDELAGVLERRRELAALVNECQRVFGKIFNNSEVATIAGLVDYLGLDGEYILLLLAHCVRMEKKSMRYVEKTAISLHDEGVLDAKALEERLHRIELMAGAMGRIRKKFGIASRELTTREKKYIEKWICVMQYSDDVLQIAYDITVHATGNASVAYTNTILERWYAEGYRTADEVQAAITEYRQKKQGASASFEVDDFFEAALKRSYGE